MASEKLSGVFCDRLRELRATLLNSVNPATLWHALVETGVTKVEYAESMVSKMKTRKIPKLKTFSQIIFKRSKSNKTMYVYKRAKYKYGILKTMGYITTTKKTKI